MAETDSHITEMIDALSANIEYLKENGSSQVIIRNGELELETPDKYIYRFELDSQAYIDADADVEVIVNRHSTSGRVVSIESKIVRIELEQNLGSHISEARLLISSYYLLERLREKIDNSDHNGFGDKVLNLEEVSSVNSIDVQLLPTELNTYQKKALSVVAQNEVTYIWGPPGTGKTQTIASILEFLNNSGLSVLLLSHTNVATDEALYKASKHLRRINNDDFREGRVIRVGDIKHEQLNKEFGEFVVPEQIIERKTKSIRADIKEAERKIDELNGKILPIIQKLADIDEYQHLVGVIRKKQEFLDAQKASYADTKNQISKTQELLDINKSEQEAFNNRGAFGKLLSKHNPEFFENRRIQLQNTKRSLSEKLEGIRQTTSKELTLLKNLDEEITKLNVKFTDLNVDALKQEKDDYQSKIGDLQNEINDYYKEIERLSEILIQEASVIATTLTKSYMNESVLDREYDCVIIDELSMAPIPAVWFASSLATRRVVLVGDFFQLPPVVRHEIVTKRKSEEEIEYESSVVDKWLKQDVFDISGISAAIRQNSNELPVQTLCQLKEQYRMQEPIAELVNALVYGKYGGGKFKLETGKFKIDEPDPLDNSPLSNHRIGVFDTSEQRPYVLRTDSGSKYSILNALICVALAEKAISAGYESVGIISAYRAQANLLQSIIKDKGEEFASKVEADTVHKFQGGEKAVIIFDITTPYVPSMYDDMSDLGDDEKLVNVAISRAKLQCIVVGDVKNIESRHSESSLMRKLLGFCRENNYPFYSTREILDDYTVNQETENWLKKVKETQNPEDTTVFDEKDFYQNFIHDLFSAEKEIVIVSPFITEYRSEQIIPVLINAQRKGVKVFVLTRHPNNHTGNMVYESQSAIQKLEENGITVLPFKKSIHQKLSIIDRKVMWEGSLNILSQRDSQEYMRRFSGDGATAVQVMKYLRLDKNIGKIGENGIEHCEYCDEPGSWYWNDVGRFGEWTFCLQRSHKKGDRPKSDKEIKAKKQKISNLRKSEKEYVDGVPICPVHNEKMTKKQGRFGEFWGCPQYRKLGCKITEKIS